jgi:hypothetical protein
MEALAKWVNVRSDEARRENKSNGGEVSAELRKQVLKQIKGLRLGDLIKVSWFDASIGSSRAGAIDVPVDSWGVFIGVLGERNKHIVLAQNNFRYVNGLNDVDYTAIPLSWTVSIKIISQELSEEEAKGLLNSFLLGRSRTLKRRTHNHGS